MISHDKSLNRRIIRKTVHIGDIITVKMFVKKVKGKGRKRARKGETRKSIFKEEKRRRQKSEKDRKKQKRTNQK